jgi:cytochrome P450
MSGLFDDDLDIDEDIYREHSRALLRPQFSRQQVADLELLEVHVQHMFKHLDLIVDDYNNWSAPIDLSPLFFRLTLDSATEFLFGQSVQSQLQALPAGHVSQGGGDSELDWRSLAGAFDRGTSGLAARARLGDLYWMHNPKSFRDDCKEVQRFADYYVSQALQRLESENEKEKPEMMTDEQEGKKKRYVFLEELIKDTKDPIELRCQLLHILLAGRDTTAGLLGWACWNLARQPAVFNKLRTTILETFGSYDQPHEISFERLKTCSYLQHTLNETLRLYPSVPLNAREATRDTSLPCGGGPDGQSRVYIKKGEDVSYSVYAMHRRKDIWGDDAESFVPERWVGRKTGWEYLPFNGGPRICLGQQFALTEAGYVLTRLIQRFDRMAPCQPHEEPKHQYSVTSAPKKVLVRMHSA